VSIESASSGISGGGETNGHLDNSHLRDI
jgi:hypothetical protein